MLNTQFQNSQVLPSSVPESLHHRIDQSRTPSSLYLNIANTVILGALARQTQLISLKSLKQAIKQKFKNKGKEIINKNIKAIEAAYNEKFE